VGHRSFKDLEAYRNAARLADEIRVSAMAWNGFDRWTIGLQIVRAANSVGANIAEAYGRGTTPDRRRLLLIARGSACELDYWLERARAAALPCPPEASSRARQIGRLLNGLIRTLGQH
jgi:four helix bundle protein